MYCSNKSASKKREHKSVRGGALASKRSLCVHLKVRKASGLSQGTLTCWIAPLIKSAASCRALCKSALRTLCIWSMVWLWSCGAHALGLGKCEWKQVSPTEGLVSSFVAGQVRAKALELDRAAANQGYELKVILISRGGSLVKGFSRIKDRPHVPYHLRLANLARMVEARRHAYTRQVHFLKQDPNKWQQLLYLPPELVHPEPLDYVHLGLLLKTNPRVKGEAPLWSYVVDLGMPCTFEGAKLKNSDIFYTLLDAFYWGKGPSRPVVASKYKRSIRTRLIVPHPSLQQPLWELSQNKPLAYDSLHEPQYNLGAVPYVLPRLHESRQWEAMRDGAWDYKQQKDQNSNQWVLELIAAAMDAGVKTRAQAQELLFQTNYRPSLLWPESFKQIYSCALSRGTFLRLWNWEHLLNCRNQVYVKYNLAQAITEQSVLDYLTYNRLLAPNTAGQDQKGVYVLEVGGDVFKVLSEVGKKFAKSSCPLKIDRHWCKPRLER